MLDVFRKASKAWIVKLLFALLTLSFVSWGVGDVIRGGGNRGPAIEVGKISISAGEVNTEFKREVERLQPLFGGKLTAAEARKLGLMDRTIDTIISRSLLDEAGRGLGLAANDEAIVRRTQSNPAFRGATGQYDRDVFRQRLARVGYTEESYLRAERSNTIRNQMGETLAGGIAAPAVLADPLQRYREERRVAEAIMIKDESVPLPAAPDAAALETYFKDNTGRFMAPEYRALTVLLLRPADVAGNVDIDEMMVREAYQQRQDEFNTPERREISQIVLEDQSAAAKATDLATQGKDLAVIAKELNSPVLDLGIVERRDLPDGLSDAVFKLASGKTGQPVKTALGWHVVKVSTIQAGRTRGFNEVKGQLEQDLRREKALDALSELATKLEDALGGGATLEEAGKRFNLKTVKVAALDAQGNGPNGKPVADLPKSDQFLDVAFHNEPGTESPLTEVQNNGYFLLRVDGVTPPAPKALADIKTEVIATWQAEKRHDAAKAKADKLAERLKAGDSAQAVAQSAGVVVETTKPFTREGKEGTALPAPVVAELFRAAQGGVAVGTMPNGVLVARLAKIIPVNPSENMAATAGARRQISQAVATDIVDQYLAALNASLGVKVDRSQLATEE
ncbi:Parvulin-like peptidyl-prolyl isomerase [Candidatus Terasakiella magnetica]|nr:Parvulin-like peptidyl-prolyl isomerase [Candidatus Terasakiella magnetica]